MTDDKGTIRLFTTLLEDAEMRLRETLELVTTGRAPTAEQITGLNNSVVGLRESYDALRAAATGGGDTIADELPGSHYIEVLEEKQRMNALKARFEQVMHILTLFETVKSDVKAFDEAIAPYRKETADALSYLSAIDDFTIPESYAQMVEPRKLFIDAVNLDTLDSEEGLELLDRMGDAYPLKVHQGLMFGRYYLASDTQATAIYDASSKRMVADAALIEPHDTVIDASNEEAGEEETATEENASDVTPDVTRQEPAHLTVVPTALAGEDESIDASQHDHTSDYLLPMQGSRATKSVNVASWRRDFLNTAPKSIRVTLPTLAFFECLNAEQFELISGYMDNGRDKPADVRKAIDYMLRKGLAVKYDMSGETIYCLSDYSCQLVAKDGIKNLKRGRVSYWTMTFREDCRGFDDRVSTAFLRARLMRNALFVKFAEAVATLHRERRMGPVSHAVTFDADDSMTVRLKWEGAVYACALLSSGERPPENAENIVIVAGDDEDLQVSLQDSFAGKVFVVHDGTITLATLSEVVEGVLSDEDTDNDSQATSETRDEEYASVTESVTESEGEQPVVLNSADEEESTSEPPYEDGVLDRTVESDKTPEFESVIPRDESSKVVDGGTVVVSQVIHNDENDEEQVAAPQGDTTPEMQAVANEAHDESRSVIEEHAGERLHATNRDVLDLGPADAELAECPSCELSSEICEGIVTGTYGTWEDSNLSDRIGVAITFAKAVALSDNSKGNEGLFHKLLLSTDSNIAPHQYTLDQIREAFTNPGQDEFEQALLLCTYLRAMFNPTKPYDYALWDAFDFYATNYDDYFGSYPEAKMLFEEMQGIHEISKERGFTPAVIDRLDERARKKNRLQEICAMARELMTVRKVKEQIKGVIQFHETAFGKHSELGIAMAAIADDDEGALDMVSKLARRFAGDELIASSSNTDAIKDDISQTWREKVLPRINTHKHKGNRDLDYDARNTAIAEYLKRVEVMCAWVSYKESRVTDEVLKAMGDKRLRVLNACDRALDSVADTKRQIGGEFLYWTIEDIAERLRGTNGNSVSYIDFLRTGLISLSDEMLPLVEEMECKVSHFEPWRRILSHVRQRGSSLQDAYARIQDPENSSDNVRQAEQLRSVLGIQPLSSREREEAIELAAKQADSKMSSLKDDLEIWYAYGRINDDQRETLAAIADDLREPMYEMANFDLWHMMLDALRKTADDWSAVQFHELQDRCDSARLQLRGSEESPLLEEAGRLLKDERNYAVVEDYLNRFEAGERDITRHDFDDEEDEFTRFMSDEVFQPLYERAVAGKETTNRFKIAAKRLVAERHTEDWTEEQFESSNKLIASWPSNKGYSTTQLRDLFVGMGFDATYGEKVKATDLNVEHYRVHLRPTARNHQSYNHPIAAFGTQAAESVDVVVTYENASPQSVVQLVSSLHANEAVAVLVDYHLDRASRRKVAELYMKMASRPTKFLLIDRVLLMHLAQAQLRERLAMLLKCTLPLTYLQPFTNGGGSTADEMFCGRVAELGKIMDFNGACIIYGGRQLGKTAILERAASLVNDPENHQLAVKVSIKGLSDEQIVVQKITTELNRELKRVRKSLSLEKCSTVYELCQEIDELFESKSVSRMLLLLDETDYFLAAISGNEYAQLEPLDELRMRRSGSFKYVLAGLHNVVRATRNTKNVIFGRLGEPVCIKPLPPRDALRLLRRPLLYLGYHVDYPNVETILTNTNYYPGLVQFFGNKLVESMSTHFDVYYKASRLNPPYPLKEKQLASIFTDYDINVAIRDKFMATLELDERDRYMLIAQIIAAIYYDRKNKGQPTNEGFTLHEIKGFSDEWHFSKLSLETNDTFMALLDELCEMGVLTHVGASRDHYRIRRSTFLGYIGSEEAIWDAFDKEELDEG